MDRSRVMLANLPPILRHAIGIVEDCPVNARVVDNVAANIVSWAKWPFTVTGLMP